MHSQLVSDEEVFDQWLCQLAVVTVTVSWPRSQWVLRAPT